MSSRPPRGTRTPYERAEDPLAELDPEVHAALRAELHRQQSAVFPGMQRGPLEHVIAAKAVSFKIAASPEFAERQARTLAGSRILAERLTRPDVAADGVKVLTGGTDVHLVLVDLRDSELDDRQAEDLRHEIGITINRNALPFDPRPPVVTSGLRISTPALATRSFTEEDFAEVADVSAPALQPEPDIAAPRARTEALAAKHPLYPHRSETPLSEAHLSEDGDVR